MSATALAFASAALAVAALSELVVQARGRAPQLLDSIGRTADVLVRVGTEGRDPGAGERRRMLIGGAAITFSAGFALLGPLPALALGAGGPWLASRVLRARRERYRRAVEGDAAGIAVALADALSAGHSLRGALAGAAAGMPGAGGHELRRVASELAAGARTEHALDAMRIRARSARLDTVVAACLVQRRAGGDLARLLRECAESFADQARLEDEVRSATAQARFTGVIVVLLPLCGALLAELASPGFMLGLVSSFLTAWLVGIALVLQVVAAVAIRRLGRVRW